ncbi:MAG: hypothetical protein HPY62_06965 [Bacteroidales bacterium]|nr:hypothetical protein [Bacteroidales bacterium]
MANKRKIKKDIDCLTFEVISDCFAWGAMHPDSHEEEVTEIIADAVILRNDLFDRVNNFAKGENPKDVKAHFRLIKKDLFTGTDKLFKRLSALSGK